MLRRDPLFQVEATAIAEEVLSSIRHDMRNKIGSIRTAAFYLKRKLKTTEVFSQDSRLEQFLQLIEDEALRSNEILSRPVGKVEERTPIKISAQALIERAIECLRAEDPDALEVVVVAAPSEITVYPDEVALSLRCLLENAAEAIGSAGRVEISAEVLNNNLQFTVTDTGPGIPEERHEDLLMPFYSTKPGCLGLGLNIARRVANRYRGSLRILPSERGASVSLLLPIHPPEDYQS
jgi:signal transduction histidine kinase